MPYFFETYEIVGTWRNPEPIRAIRAALESRHCEFHEVMLDSRRFLFLRMQNKRVDDILYHDKNVRRITSFTNDEMCMLVENQHKLCDGIETMSFGMAQPDVINDVKNGNTSHLRNQIDYLGKIETITFKHATYPIELQSSGCIGFEPRDYPEIFFDNLVKVLVSNGFRDKKKRNDHTVIG